MTKLGDYFPCDQFERDIMMHYWTCHWQNRYWINKVNPEYKCVCGSGSNMFRKRGVSVGDIVYIISLSNGQLFLGGKMTVNRIVSRAQAVRILGNNNLYNAKEWIINDDNSGTPLNLHRCLAPEISRQLSFMSPKSGNKGLFFVSESKLDVQTTRGVRELTPESAHLFDRIIKITDQFPRSDKPIIVTEDLLRKNTEDQDRLPETIEVTEQEVFQRNLDKERDISLKDTSENRKQRLKQASKFPLKIRVIRTEYKRNQDVVAEVFERANGYCEECGKPAPFISASKQEPYLEIHHRIFLSERGEDTVENAMALCPNCHREKHFGWRVINDRSANH